MARSPKDPGYEGKFERDPMADGIQERLNNESEGWILADFVVIVGVARATDNGWERRAFLYEAEGQADYVTDGLVGKVQELQAESSWAEIEAEAEGEEGDGKTL